MTLAADERGPCAELRPLTGDDVETLASWGEDPVFRAAAEWGASGTEARRAFWQRMVDAPPADLLRFGARIDGQLVGTVDLHGDQPRERELGFLVARPFWGRGFGAALARSGIDHGFDLLGLERIWAEALEANGHSIRILERCMRRTGRGATGTYLGEPTNYVRFALTRQEWEAREPSA